MWREWWCVQYIYLVLRYAVGDIFGNFYFYFILFSCIKVCGVVVCVRLGSRWVTHFIVTSPHSLSLRAITDLHLNRITAHNGTLLRTATGCRSTVLCRVGVEWCSGTYCVWRILTSSIERFMRWSWNISGLLAVESWYRARKVHLCGCLMLMLNWCSSFRAAELR
jgi:hypothetical protein